MKYFTYELWNKINNVDLKTREEANQKWLENILIYSEQFKKVEKYLSKDFLKKFKRYEGFHDYEFKSMKIEQPINSLPVLSIIIALNEETCEIKYKGINKIDIQYGKDKNILGFGIGFNTIGYNEFSIDENLSISHEILLSSGATILVHFNKIFINKILNRNDN